jgi:D-alanine-D-alanine ligase
MKVALLFNEKPAHAEADLPDDTYEEYDEPATVCHIAAALRRLDVTVEPVPADRRLPSRLEEGRFDFAFNIAEGPIALPDRARRCREALPAAVCELLGVPFTGSDVLTLALTLDKALARRVVSPEVPVAPGVLLEDEPWDDLFSGLRFPAIVKPNDEGSSKGIHADSLAVDSAAASAVARRLRESYRCPLLVEEFLPGAEVTVALAGNPPNVRLLGMMEIAPASDGGPFVYSLEVKRDFRRRVAYHIPPRLDAPLIATIESYAREAYRLLGCRDIARMDFRLNASGQPCFMECNPLPGLNPETSDIVILTGGAIPYDRLVQGILLDALRRTGVRVS